MLPENDTGFPKWWIILFGGTFFVAIFYIPYVFTPHEPYPAQNSHPENSLKEQDSLTLSMFSSNNSLKRGKEIFFKKCAICHGELGAGGIGPNLTDSYWLYGNRPEDLLKVITEGVPSRGMVAWKKILPSDAIKDVRDYVQTLAGTNPPHPKTSQGQLYPE